MPTSEQRARAEEWLDTLENEWLDERPQQPAMSDDEELAASMRVPESEPAFSVPPRRHISGRRFRDPTGSPDVDERSVLQGVKEWAGETLDPWAATLVGKGVDEAEDVYYGSRRAMGAGRELLTGYLVGLPTDALDIARAVRKDVDLPETLLAPQYAKRAFGAAAGAGEYADPRFVSQRYTRRATEKMIAAVDDVMRDAGPFSAADLGREDPASSESERMYTWDELSDADKLKAIYRSKEAAGRYRQSKWGDIETRLDFAREDAKDEIMDAFTLP